MVNFPIIRFHEWNVQEIASPIGNRHIPGAATAFQQILTSGCVYSTPGQPLTTSGVLKFEDLKFTITDGSSSSHLESRVSVLTVNLGASGTSVTNMKLYLADDSALDASHDAGLDPSFVQFTTSGAWLQNVTLPSGAGTVMPVGVPISPNIKRQDGTLGLHTNDDFNSSEFIYMNLVVPFGTALGEYGACGSGNLRFALTFDYYDTAGDPLL
jgi:hypothetical protein